MAVLHKPFLETDNSLFAFQGDKLKLIGLQRGYVDTICYFKPRCQFTGSQDIFSRVEFCDL